MLASHWPVALALAWVATRDDAFIAQEIDWDCEGKSVLAVMARHTYSAHTNGNSLVLPFGESCKALRRAVLKGIVKTREPISARDWPHDFEIEGLIGWIDVVSLQAAFPPLASSAQVDADETGGTTASQSDAPALKAAFDQCYPDGVPQGVKPMHVYNRLVSWFEDTGARQAPHRRTFNRHKNKFWRDKKDSSGKSSSV